MNWNDHKKLEGLHAFLGASQFHWLNWNDEMFEKHFVSKYAADIGTAIHQLASDCIKSRTRLTEHDAHLIDITLYKGGFPKSVYDSQQILENLIPFVNDAIGFHMSSEVILYYSMFCFGTTDAIGYDEKEKILRIHDYKSGTIKAHVEQLLIYAALFCLEYHIAPKNLKRIELRIYQSNDIQECFPEAREVERIMELIKFRSKTAQELYGRDAE